MSNHDFSKQSRANHLKKMASQEKDKNLLIEKRLKTLQAFRGEIQASIKGQNEKRQIENLRKQLNQL